MTRRREDSPKLDATDRVILACVGAKMPQSEIAEALGCDRATVHRRLARIRGLIRETRPVSSLASA